MIFSERNFFQPPISLLEYLQQRGWKPAREHGREELSGLCPLHRETRPSFYVNRRKQVFYCHGCGCGGGLSRLVQLLESSTPGAQSLMERTYCFYQTQLARFEKAQAYLALRGIRDRNVIARMRIGYAPGACLRGHLERSGYSRQALLQRGLIDERGRDRFFDCLTFPLPQAGNLYGRSLTNTLFRHRFLPGTKGGLYGAEDSPGNPILVEGLFDVAALWQAGFPAARAVLGSYLNNLQLAGLCRPEASPIYICFDADRNGAGPRAARGLSIQLRQAGLEALRVELPCGHDPNSFFTAGACAADFKRCLERAQV